MLKRYPNFVTIINLFRGSLIEMNRITESYFTTPLYMNKFSVFEVILKIHKNTNKRKINLNFQTIKSRALEANTETALFYRGWRLTRFEYTSNANIVLLHIFDN